MQLWPLAILVILSSSAAARDMDGKYAQSPYKEWFSSQRNEMGQFCCDESDGHPFFGNYTVNQDGSVTVEAEGKKFNLPGYMVLKGANPTGHAVWWYLEYGGMHTDYCFSPGSLG